MEKEIMTSKFNEQLFKSQLEIQEQTFDLISMEIHDNVGQTLSLLKVQLNILEQKEQYDRALVGDIKGNVGKAMTDLRDVAKSLNSERVQLSSLAELTAHELNRLESTGIITTEQKILGTEQVLSNDRKLILFRIIQESLQNITKHSHASVVTISINYQEAGLFITINDNGLGFDTSGRQSGLGLQNIKSRAAVIGGEAIISSANGNGTKITITIPYE